LSILYIVLLLKEYEQNYFFHLKVAVIILNWNGAEDTIECVKSVLLQHFEGDFDIYLLDNASNENDKQLLKNEFETNPKIIFKWLSCNFGFGLAHNIIFNELLDKMIYDYWAIINNDAYAEQGWLQYGIETFNDKTVDVVACKMVNYYSPSQIDSAGLTLLNTGEILPNGSGDDVEKYSTSKKVVAFSAGACFLKPYLVYQHGGFDCFFETGYEDAELGLRYSLQGANIVYNPNSTVKHKISSSINKIANWERAVKTQRDIHYTWFKLLPKYILAINLIPYLFRTIVLLLLHIVTNRLDYVKIWYQSVEYFYKIDFQEAKKKKIKPNIGFIKILLMQTNFIIHDLKRFNKYFIKNIPNHFEKMAKKNRTLASNNYTKAKFGLIADSIDNQYAGIHYYTLNLLKAISKTKNCDDFVIVRQKEDNELFNFRQKVIKPLFSFLRLDPIRTFIKIPYFFNSQKVDIVIEPAHFGPFFLRKNIKRVTVIHDLTPLLLPQFHPFYSILLQKIMLKRILKKADLVIVNSENTKNDVTKMFPVTQNKIKRIYLGKDESISKTDSKEGLQEYNISSPYILYVGTIEPRKNLIELLSAFQLLKDKKYPHKLVIVGKLGWKNKDFYNALNNHKYSDDIVCTGYVPQEMLASIYSHATVFVYPSLYEGFGFPVLEAMSCGVPVVTSNSSSLTEIADGNCLHYQLGSAIQLTECIEKIITNSVFAQELSNKGKKQSEKFTWDNCAKEFLEALDFLQLDNNNINPIN
jgi:glycosyltransferase involved in cell wall biosynthesis/GT2 family glycosyltransferase